MRSKVRAYSHHGHGPRADQQAGYISATSDTTTSLAKRSRSIHEGHLRKPPIPNVSFRSAPLPDLQTVADVVLGADRKCVATRACGRTPNGKGVTLKLA